MALFTVDGADEHGERMLLLSFWYAHLAAVLMKHWRCYAITLGHWMTWRHKADTLTTSGEHVSE